MIDKISNNPGLKPVSDDELDAVAGGVLVVNGETREEMEERLRKEQEERDRKAQEIEDRMRDYRDSLLNNNN